MAYRVEISESSNFHGSELVRGLLRRPVPSYTDSACSQTRSYLRTSSQIYQFETVRARPFEDKPRPYYRPQAQSPPPPLVSPPQPAPPQQPQYMTYNDDDDYRYMPPTQPQQYSPRSYDYQDHQRSVRSEDQQLTQSRTFKVLESLMSSEVDPTRETLIIPPPSDSSLANTISILPPSCLAQSVHTPISSSLYPWRRRHTVTGVSIYANHNLGDGSGKIAADQEVSTNSFQKIRKSETCKLVHDMDQEERQGLNDDNRARLWHRQRSVDSALLGSKPWFYKQYSNQVFNKSIDVEGGIEVFGSRILRRKSKYLARWDFENIQTEVASYVKQCKRQDTDRVNRTRTAGDGAEALPEEGFQLENPGTEEQPKRRQASLPNSGYEKSLIALQGIIDDNAEDSIHSDEFLDEQRSIRPLQSTMDSGYGRSLSVSSERPTELVELILAHYDLDSLAIETVSVSENPELTNQMPELVKYISVSRINLIQNRQEKTARKAKTDVIPPEIFFLPSLTFNPFTRNIKPAAGVTGLPPQRTLSQERWKAEQDAKRSSPRVKVFMPQQYNSPLGIYSAKNVVETFQAQAETVMDAMERPFLFASVYVTGHTTKMRSRVKHGRRGGKSVNCSYFDDVNVTRFSSGMRMKRSAFTTGLPHPTGFELRRLRRILYNLF
ncbi:hypothetical protein LSH36_269g10001 [Paralvinella palmiformis]|uniref:Zasp-like motif domain-containing protein n=1 Tax=Paralvinella palmiformis TaxID=53620 RepID=A0AAD9JKK5_9ANNE|nr:hypothetical protein LSH36_269g10001 [Paralvinella palmiformis]